MKLSQLTKSGCWSSLDGPMYRSADRRIQILGYHATLGNNYDGWRKTRLYRLSIDGKDVASSSRLSTLLAKIK